uniref:dUTPase-like domain-containing protein n=1 Tax=Plectus sambesii TaxID=2011161 RepID=A0A914V2S4_9BILA
LQVKRGERIAQLICERVCLPDLLECTSLDETERGEGGFGTIKHLAPTSAIHCPYDSRADKRGEQAAIALRRAAPHCVRPRNCCSLLFADASVGGVGSAALPLAALVAPNPPHIGSSVSADPPDQTWIPAPSYRVLVDSDLQLSTDSRRRSLIVDHSRVDSRFVFAHPTLALKSGRRKIVTGEKVLGGERRLTASSSVHAVSGHLANIAKY